MRAQHIQFQLPWVRVTAEEKPRLEAELIAERCLLHNLAAVDCCAIARRVDSDDVLFALSPNLCECAVIHLMWSVRVEMDPRYPAYELHATFDDWVQERMVPDHNEHSTDRQALHLTPSRTGCNPRVRQAGSLGRYLLCVFV
jgi:hypothetical protein